MIDSYKFNMGLEPLIFLKLIWSHYFPKTGLILSSEKKTHFDCAVGTMSMCLIKMTQEVDSFYFYFRSCEGVLGHITTPLPLPLKGP